MNPVKRKGVYMKNDSESTGIVKMAKSSTFWCGILVPIIYPVLAFILEQFGIGMSSAFLSSAGIATIGGFAAKEAASKFGGKK